MRRVAAAIVLGSLTLASCSSGPPCLRSHTEMLYLPQYNAALKQMVLTWIPVEQCDQYARAGR